MFRYMAFVWDAGNPPELAAVQRLVLPFRSQHSGWTQVLSCDGLQVFCTHALNGGLGAQCLHANAGVILGALFEARKDPRDPSPSPKARLDQKETARIVASRAESLTREYWGNYVAFIRQPQCRGILVVKDPVGALPCYYAKLGSALAFFSSAADCVTVRSVDFCIEPSYLVERVLSGASDAETRPLAGVDEVYRGECIEISYLSGHRSLGRQFYWNPLSFTGPEQSIENPTWTAAAMRNTVRACTHTLVRDHTAVLHRLSGGLDSTIMAACLRDAPSRPRTTCYTYYDPSAQNDERPWARIAAAHFGLEHVECACDPEEVRLADVDSILPSVEPASIVGYLQRGKLERQLAAERNASAVLTGLGGDSGFGSDATALAALEYLKRHGLRTEFFRLAARVALNSERSTWSVVFRSLRRWILGSSMNDQREGLLQSCTLASAEIRNAMSVKRYYPHPWFRGVSDIPWATIRRLGSLPYPAQFYDVLAGNGDTVPELISPLYSQPAIELFLRIPLYAHFENGHDRGLARRAFALNIPAAICRRRWKDRAPRYFDVLVDRNIEFLRELLFDGVLMQQGLLDPRALDAALTRGPNRSATLPGEILRHMDTELWARGWRNTQRHSDFSCGVANSTAS